MQLFKRMQEVESLSRAGETVFTALRPYDLHDSIVSVAFVFLVLIRVLSRAQFCGLASFPHTWELFMAKAKGKSKCKWLTKSSWQMAIKLVVHLCTVCAMFMLLCACVCVCVR